MNPFALSGILAAISSLSVGLFVLVKSSNRKLGRIWFLFALSVALWEFAVTWWALARSPEEGLQAARTGYLFGVLWIAVFFNHFVEVFLEVKSRHLIIVNYVIALCFLPIIYTPLLFDHARWIFDSIYYPVAGKLFPVFFVWWVALVFMSHYQLAGAYKSVSIQKQSQIKYFFLATAIGFSGGSLCYLPNFKIDLYPWGNFAVLLYPYIMAYAIVRHRLMDITIVIKKTLVYGVLLAVGIACYVAFVAHFTHREIAPLSNTSIMTAVLSLAMAIFVLVGAPKRKLTVVWSLTCFSIACWSLGFAMMTRSTTLEACLFWQKWVLYTGSIMIPVLYLHFVSLLVNMNIKKTLQVSYLVAFSFQGVNALGLLATAGAKPPFYFYTKAIFPAYHAFTLYFICLAGYAHWLLFKRMRESDAALKNQLQYVFIGTTVGFLGGAMTFPLCFDIPVFPIGAYVVSFYLIAVTYAIYKHRLMDINLVLRKSVVYSVMTAILTAVYVTVITQGSHLLQGYFGASTLMVSIIAACLITAIFLPLRNKVQTLVDHYFFPDWADREVVREVAAGFSHELKSPLAGLSMQAQLALAELKEVEEGRKSWLKALPRIKGELEYLVNKSMDAARRIEAVRGVAEPGRGEIEPVDVPAVLDSSLSALESLVIEVSPQIKRDIPSNLPPVRSNTKQLEIVFINLMKNALESMDGFHRSEPHALSLAGIEQNGSVLVSVKDTGAGIAAKDLDHIFDPHFTTKGRKGTGMGLFLAHQIIKAHGGVIDVQSQEGRGTEFLVRLPRYAASAAA